MNTASLLLSVIALLMGIYHFIITENIKKDINKHLFIHKLQFEKEFQIYTELWTNIVELRQAIYQLRPIFDQRPANKTQDEIEKERMAEAVTIGNKFIKLVESNKPFYYSELYKDLYELNILIRKEIVTVQHKSTVLKQDPMKYWDEGEATIKKLDELTDRVCDSIRQRILILN